jgi:RNA recognition motif-containing protein
VSNNIFDMNIFVGSLPFSIEEADLRESFEAYGAVDSVKVITDKFTGRSKGFGFVEMPNDEEALKAIEELNGATVQGRAIVVNKSEPKPEGERRSFQQQPFRRWWWLRWWWKQSWWRWLQRWWKQSRWRRRRKILVFFLYTFTKIEPF